MHARSLPVRNKSMRQQVWRNKSKDKATGDEKASRFLNKQTRNKPESEPRQCNKHDTSKEKRNKKRSRNTSINRNRKSCTHTHCRERPQLSKEWYHCHSTCEDRPERGGTNYILQESENEQRKQENAGRSEKQRHACQASSQHKNRWQWEAQRAQEKQFKAKPTTSGAFAMIHS